MPKLLPCLSCILATVWCPSDRSIRLEHFQVNTLRVFNACLLCRLPSKFLRNKPMLKNTTLCLIATLIFTPSFVNAGEGWYSTYEEAKDAATTQGVPLLIHFHASWCGPCRQMESQVLSQPQIRQQLRNGLAAVEVDVSQHPDVAQLYGATTVPRDVVVMPGENPKTVNVGFKSLAGYSSILSQVSRPATSSKATPVAKSTTIVGLEGFCPVELLGQRKWVSGREDLKETYRGVTYYLSSEKALKAFRHSPRKFTPQNLGCDPVVLYSDQQAVTGKIKFGAFFDNQLFLFDTFENRKAFKESPLKYTRIQHAVKVDELAGQRFN